jgi:hypothetical protein
MPLFFDASINALHNTVQSRLVSNDSGYEFVPLGDGYCANTSLWQISNPASRQIWVQIASNGSAAPLVFELIPHYGRMLTTILARVGGGSYSIMPTVMPKVQLLSMPMSTSVPLSTWNEVAFGVDPSGTTASYNAYHDIVVAPTHVLAVGNRYAISVVADQSSTPSMVLEGIQINYAFLT